MKLILPFLVFVGLSLIVRAQERNALQVIDSLMAIPDYAAARTFLATSESSQPSGSFHVRLMDKLAAILVAEGKLDEAETLIQQLQNQSTDPVAQALTKTAAGFLYLNKTRYDLALSNLQQAWQLFQDAHLQETEDAATCLADLSLVYLSTGKLNQALENGRMALQLRMNLRGEKSEIVAASYNDLGLVLSQTDTDAALEYYEKALAVYEQLHGKNHPKIAIANTNLGFLYLDQRLYGDAITNFETAESIWKNLYPQGHPNQALALLNLGRAYAKMGNNKAAKGYFHRALEIYRRTLGPRHSDVAFTLNQLGILLSSDNQYDSALSYFQEALIANTKLFKDQALTHTPSIRDSYNGKVLLYSLRLKAETLESRHYGNNLKLEDLTLALRSLQSCDTLIDNIRSQSSNENDKLELGSSASEVYEDGVRIATALSEMTLHARPYSELAFYFAEKSKSAVLQESIADAEAKSYSGIPPDLLNEERNLKATLALLAQKLSQKLREGEDQGLRESLFEENQKYRSFTAKLEKDFPAYYNLKFNSVSPSIPALQKILGPGIAMVSYFIAEKDHRLYTFVIDQRRFKIYHSTLPEDFDRAIKGFNNSLYYSVASSYREASNKLSRILLRGIPNSATELIIIPAGRLGTLPFEALSGKWIPARRAMQTEDFLVNKFAISYEFSAGLLLQKSRNVPSEKISTIFLCAPVQFPAKDHLDDLPGSEKEIASIAQLFSDRATVAKGPNANETRVKSGELQDYRYLHFATHGIVDEAAPELSRIFLQTSPEEDGNLFSGEIFNLRLNADLAVLSACQTGLGKFSKGEGVIGLSRALVYAGARNMVVSYWTVADESTSTLMTDFYQRLLQTPGINFRQALQRAKISMIKNRTYSSPYFWAPFVLIGF